ncbi:hypothetical protein [uncultured Capnocytophaga sp.]|uniref:hypothetical protein n=1 Tax=uncultured Capnocytophaga sp. TaxID=159273 RepID=UPI002603BC71|nr:hypothetical protein [uncultured Capnocytophaga sp.]
MKNKRPHFGRVFAVSFLLYILYFGIIDTIDTSIDNKLFLVLISPAFLVLGILIFYAFYSDTARYMLFFFITIAMLYLSIIFTLVVGVLIYFSFFYKSEKVRKIAKIGLFISGFFAIPLIASFFGYNSLYNSIAKTFSDMTFPSKYEEYVALSGNTVSYEANTMEMLPEGENKLIEFAFVNQKNELIISDDESLGYLFKYDTQGNRIDTLKIEKIDGIDNLFDGFYGDYLVDFKRKRYCSWAIDGNKSFQPIEQLSDYEMSEEKRMDLFGLKNKELVKDEESQRRDKIIPQYFKKESSGSSTSYGVGGEISYRTTWKEGAFFFSIQVNGNTFHLKDTMTMSDGENFLDSSTSYFSISGGTLEQYENYQVYTHPKWDYVLFACKNHKFSNTYRLFIIKNKKE